MKFGFVVPWADATEVGELAEAAESNGWDGLFVWEPVWGVDAWVSLGLAAARTSRIRLGTMLTPPSRRRPWELASQVATVDRISDGRVTLSVGLGAVDSGFAAFGEECDRRCVRDCSTSASTSPPGYGPGNRSSTTVSTIT
ncbi:MAG: LLM class flavin-dependent oxidoreductase [Actinomycetota bacterium]|nr:LLM class flavin-dependent oxidoreductase [Actinomycetota bacterium]